MRRRIMQQQTTENYKLLQVGLTVNHTTEELKHVYIMLTLRASDRI